MTIDEILAGLGNWWRNGYVQSPKHYPELSPNEAKQAIEILIKGRERPTTAPTYRGNGYDVT